MMFKDDGTGVVVRVLDDGPIHVIGDFDIVDAEGNAFPKRRLFSFCRCGLSARKPYCDGAHREARFANRFRAPDSSASGSGTAS